jgi:hypothetical protein
MASKVWGYNEFNFLIVKLNLQGKAKDSYKKFEPPLAD